MRAFFQALVGGLAITVAGIVACMFFWVAFNVAGCMVDDINTERARTKLNRLESEEKLKRIESCRVTGGVWDWAAGCKGGKVE